MQNKENKITIEINQQTMDFIDDVIKYENFRSKYKMEGDVINREDFVKAAIFHVLSDIQNYYKKHIIQSRENLLKQVKLRNRFKQLMEEKRMRQKDLIEITGIDKANLSNILNNKQQPGSDYFLRLWVALDCPKIEDIYYREE